MLIAPVVIVSTAHISVAQETRDSKKVTEIKEHIKHMIQYTERLNKCADGSDKTVLNAELNMYYKSIMDIPRKQMDNEKYINWFLESIKNISQTINMNNIDDMNRFKNRFLKWSKRHIAKTYVPVKTRRKRYANHILFMVFSWDVLKNFLKTKGLDISDVDYEMYMYNVINHLAVNSPICFSIFYAEDAKHFNDTTFSSDKVASYAESVFGKIKINDKIKIQTYRTALRSVIRGYLCHAERCLLDDSNDEFDTVIMGLRSEVEKVNEMLSENATVHGNYDKKASR